MPTSDLFNRPISELTVEEITEVLIKWAEGLQAELNRVLREHGYRRRGSDELQSSR